MGYDNTIDAKTGLEGVLAEVAFVTGRTVHSSSSLYSPIISCRLSAVIEIIEVRTVVRVLGRANSINVQKVMWCAAEIGLKVERVDVGGAFGGNDTLEYLAKNPNGRVPTIEDGDYVLWESNSIIRYLAETYGDPPWQPEDARIRACANQWMDWYLANLHPPMTTIFWQLIRTAPEDRDTDAITTATAEAAKLFAILDAQLAQRPHITGEEPSIGDIPIGCSAYRWHTMEVARPDLANLKAWYERLNTRPAFQEHVMLPLT